MERLKTAMLSRSVLSWTMSAALVVAQVAGVSIGRAYATASPSVVFTDNGDIVSIKIDGTGYKVLNQGGSGPNVSPEGTKIVYFGSCSNDPGNITPDICELRSDGTKIDLTNTASSYEQSPRWSPDGQHITFYDTRNDVSGVYIMDADGSNQHLLVRNRADVSFSPDGSKLTYSDSNGSGYQVVVADGDGSNPVFLTNEAGWNSDNPVWSPDGNSIAYVRYQEPATALPGTISVMNPDGTNHRDITTNPYSPNGGLQYMQLNWTSDSTSLVANNGPYNAITVVPVSGAGIHDVYVRPANSAYVADPSFGYLDDAFPTVNTDTGVPTLATLVWTQNPKPVAAMATLTVPATDDSSGIQKAEYFIGDTDPGQGNGATMNVGNIQNGGLNADLTTAFGTNFQPGVYKISVRAQDNAGNWSAVTSDYLVVFDATGPKDVAASKKLAPSLSGGDVLPGLTTNSQNDKASLGFDVSYAANGSINTNSKLSLDYATGQSCNSPHPSNCQSTNFSVTTVAPSVFNWLVINGQNASVGTFQGQGKLTIDGVVTTNPFKVVATDGDRTTPKGNDDATLLIYQPGADPNTASPLYRLHFNTNGNWVKVQ